MCIRDSFTGAHALYHSGGLPVLRQVAVEGDEAAKSGRGAGRGSGGLRKKDRFSPGIPRKRRSWKSGCVRPIRCFRRIDDIVEIIPLRESWDFSQKPSSQH